MKSNIVNKCKVKYKDLDHAVANTLKLLKLLKDSGLIWYSKSNLKSAFRLLPLKRASWWLLVMRIQHPVMGEKCYFFDKCLPFGASISCALFQRFSDALAHIHRYLTEGKIVSYYASMNYLDDFLFRLGLGFYVMNSWSHFWGCVNGLEYQSQKTKQNGPRQLLSS